MAETTMRVESTREDRKREMFGDAERLELHQLRVLESLYEERDDNTVARAEPVEGAMPERWVMTHGLDALYAWQMEARQRWVEHDCKGTLKVVTGAGKTILALALAEHLQNTRQPELCVAVVAPTIPLMKQWIREIKKHSNLPDDAIGELYGDSKDSFTEGKRVIVAVVPTAARKLAKDVRDAGVGDRLLLVGDECHHFAQRRGEMILTTARAYSLGLSATPETDDEPYAESIPGRGFGPIIYELSLRDAESQGILPPYTINHYGLALNPEERHRYEQLSRSVSEARQELQLAAPSGRASSGRFFHWVQNTAQGDTGLSQLAREFLSDTSRRDELLYGAEARHEAVKKLLSQTFEADPQARVILFHERISQTNQLFVDLRAAGYKAVLEHSQLPGSLRQQSLQLFRDGIAQVLVSVRSLVEGFNVPAADVGIIVAASSSSRQRIQSLGRVMRRYRGEKGLVEKAIHILYIADTKDENTYQKVDWGEATGEQRNQYFVWDLNQTPQKQEGPPRQPKLRDDEIDGAELLPGDIYEGAYEGDEFSCDTRGNITDASGLFAQNAGDLAQQIQAVKGSAGRFRITTRRHYVLIRHRELLEEDSDSFADDESGEELEVEPIWVTRFVTQLDEPLHFGATESAQADTESLQKWLSNVQPGDPYPFASIPLEKSNLKFRQTRGGVIEKRLRDKSVWAGGEDALAALQAIRKLYGRGARVSELLLNEKGHLLYRENGKLHFICALKEGFVFPE